jgi:Protein of unknown function (DUF3987)/Primase C terminal 2 (PriCT-2)
MTDLTLTTLVHDKDMARDFLTGLDPKAGRFSFQFFSDGPGRYAEVFHGTLDEVWPKIQALNTPERGVGVFVTINETDFKGRRSENIVRPRALFADADSKEQITRCMEAIEACGARPSMIVKSGRGLHFYYVCPHIPRDQFSTLQRSLIDKLGTDPAVKDLSRVMRLPGTLHLKDLTKPRLVKLYGTNKPPQRWAFSDLVATLGLSLTGAAPDRAQCLPDTFTPEAREHVRKLFGHLPDESLSEGLETNIEEIRSAVSAIPSSAISTEPEWVKFARGLAHQAAVYSKQAEELWEILDTASRRAPGYNEADNRKRWERYISEAFDREKPITIATVFDLAKKHGWQGWSPPIVTSANISGSEVGPVEGPPPAEPSFADPYAEFAGPEFPLDVLPLTLANFVDAQHRAMGADPSALAMAALTTVAGAMHAETAVCAGDGWWEKPILWTFLIGRPSAMKSPIIQKMTKVLVDIDRERNERWEQEYAKWEESKATQK